MESISKKIVDLEKKNIILKTDIVLKKVSYIHVETILIK